MYEILLYCIIFDWVSISVKEIDEDNPIKTSHRTDYGPNQSQQQGSPRARAQKRNRPFFFKHFSISFSLMAATLRQIGRNRKQTKQKKNSKAQVSRSEDDIEKRRRATTRTQKSRKTKWETKDERRPTTPSADRVPPICRGRFPSQPEPILAVFLLFFFLLLFGTSRDIPAILRRKCSHFFF